MAPELTTGAQVQCAMQVCEQRLPGGSSTAEGRPYNCSAGQCNGFLQGERSVWLGQRSEEEGDERRSCRGDGHRELHGEGKTLSGGAVENHGGALRRQNGHDQTFRKASQVVCPGVGQG